MPRTPERAGFDYGRLEIAGKWGKNELSVVWFPYFRNDAIPWKFILI
jgi:hypothetical protein